MQFNRWSIDGAVLIRISNITMFVFRIGVLFFGPYQLYLPVPALCGSRNTEKCFSSPSRDGRFNRRVSLPYLPNTLDPPVSWCQTTNHRIPAAPWLNWAILGNLITIMHRGSCDIPSASAPTPFRSSHTCRLSHTPTHTHTQIGTHAHTQRHTEKIGRAKEDWHISRFR